MFTQILSKSSTLTRILMGVVGLSLMSQITIPIQPVPITLQTIAVLFIGLTYSSRDTFFTLLSYLTLGAMGLPIFANHVGGIQHLFSHVGGFYFGFLIAAFVMASMREKIQTQGVILDLALCALGSIVLYTLGVAWLANFIGLKSAILGGVVPFIIPGIIKSFILAGLLHYVRK